MLVGHAAAGIKISVERDELFSHPPHSGADDEPAAGDNVQRRQHLGVEHRVSVGQYQNAETQVDGFRYRREIGQRGDGFQDQVFGVEGKASVRAVGVGRPEIDRDGDMVAEEDASVSQSFNFASNLRQHVNPSHGANVGKYYAVLHCFPPGVGNSRQLSIPASCVAILQDPTLRSGQALGGCAPSWDGGCRRRCSRPR